MIKTLLSPGLTPWLMQLLQSPLSPEPKEVCRLLRAGAGPWAVGKQTHEDVPPRSMFYLIQLKAPHEECLDAWFERAGPIVGEPWRKRGVPNPLHEMIETNAQPETYTAKLVGRLFEAGLVPTAPEGQKLGPWLLYHCGQDVSKFLDVITRHHPQALLEPGQWEDEQAIPEQFQKILVHASAAGMQQQTPARSTPKMPGKRF